AKKNTKLNIYKGLHGNKVSRPDLKSRRKPPDHSHTLSNKPLTHRLTKHIHNPEHPKPVNHT
ncbi:hypothetical protein VWY13_13250, partial [Phaeobacter sp. JH18-12]|uniref:hypothetical protein n=1 Tax=Phaeobacter sp. JH18-12 TaxID=3112445 RepID=UPI003A848F6B